MFERMIFVNLPVRDLDRSKAFFEALGFHFNPKFTDATAACLVISPHIHAMLLTHEKFKTFTHRAICDARQSTEVLIALNCASREDVDALMEKATAHGGAQFREPADHGFMYERSFEDPDGHVWECFWMDPAAAMGG